MATALTTVARASTDVIVFDTSIVFRRCVIAMLPVPVTSRPAFADATNTGTRQWCR